MDILRSSYATAKYDALSAMSSTDATVEGFEDNKSTPSRYAKQFLQGRCLSSSSLQDFTPEWIFQRFVNKAMQIVMKWLIGENEGWYEVRVEGQTLWQPFASGIVIVCAAVLSPILFPVVFGCAALSLTVLSPWTISHLRSFGKSKVQRQSDSDGIEWPPSEGLVETVVSSDERRYSWFSIFRTVFSSVWYFVCGSLPWLFLFVGDYSCVVDPSCEDSGIHASPLTVFGPWLACVISAFRAVHRIHVSACDCACEMENERMLQDRHYGPSLDKVIRKLASEKDKTSFYPVFVRSENEEPDAPISCVLWSVLCTFAFLHGVMPQVWMAYAHDEYKQNLTLKANWLTLLVIGVGMFAPPFEILAYLIRFVDAIYEYEDVAEQLLIFSCISSKRSQRKMSVRLNAFKKVTSANDRYRRTKGYPAFEDERERFRQRPTSQADTDENDLSDLWLYQVSFNFSRREGVMLYRKMRAWLSVDILNERSDIEWYITISLQFLALGVILLVLVWYHTGKVTATWTVVPFDILILSCLVLRGLNACVIANEYLFDDACHNLLDWLDDLAYTRHTIETNQPPAIGWIWNADTKAAEALPGELDAGGHCEHSNGIPEVRRALENTIKRIESLEEKQQILGVEVTRSYRNRIVASFGSVLVALAAKIPDLLQKNLVDIDKALAFARAAVNWDEDFHSH